MGKDKYPFQFEYRILGRMVGTEEWRIQTTNRNYHGIWFTAGGVKTALTYIKREVPGVWGWDDERQNYVKKVEHWEYKIQSRPAETEWKDI